jgi:hypothetical protein
MIVPSSWQHGTAFVDMVYKTFFQAELKTPSAFWGASIVQMQTPDVPEVFDNKVASLKVDGERHLLVLFVEQTMSVRAIIMCRNGQLMDVVVPEFARLRQTDVFRPGFFTVLDCEFYNGTWLAFDCLIYRCINGKRAAFRLDFVDRIELVKRTLHEDFLTLYVKPKPYMSVDRSPRFTARVYEYTRESLGISLEMEYDGIVFQPLRGPYPVGANMNLPSGRGLKWKPECTLDLVPERIKLDDIRRVHERRHGVVTASLANRVPWDRPVIPVEYFLHYPTCANVRRSVLTTSLVGMAETSFHIPDDLCVLRCVSDFSFGTSPLMHDVVIDGVPLCIDIPVEKQKTCCEFLFDDDLIPSFRTQRLDKATHQANKARTVAGVLWQAKSSACLDDLLEDASKITGRVTVPLPTFVSRVDNRTHVTPFYEFMKGLTFEYADMSASVENEFKVIQTKRPRAGIVYPGKQEPVYTSGPFVDVLHFQRVKNMLTTKHGKAEPTVVTTIDFIVDGSLRLTAGERVVTTKHGKKMSFFETSGFVATRKVAAGSSYIVDMPDVETKSGYVLRMDTRSETPEFFYQHDFLPDNPAYNDFLCTVRDSLKKSSSGTRVKRRVEIPQTYKGFRLVDSHEFEPETERNVKPVHVRRTCAGALVGDAIAVGEIVQVNFRGYDQFHDATITRVNTDGTVDVKYKYAVRALSSISRSDMIPIVVDARPGVQTVVRIKRRQSFEFPGFRVDLTRTRTVPNFRATPTRRLYHLTQRCDNCEIEVELVSSIARNDGFIHNLARVLQDILESMNLSENSFLFDCAGVYAIPHDALSRTVDAYHKFLHGDDVVYGDVDPVFTRALHGVSRAVKESDFHAMFDVDADNILGAVVPLESPVFSSVDDLRRTVCAENPWVENDDEHVRDYMFRRVYQGVVRGRNADFFTLHAGAYILGMNAVWGTDGNFKSLCDLLGTKILLEVDDEIVEKLRHAVFHGKGCTDIMNLVGFTAFCKAPLIFGAALADALVLRTRHAWWDKDDVHVVWEDVVDLAKRFATSLFYRRDSVAIWEHSDGDIFLYQTSVATARVAVIIGFLLHLRQHVADSGLDFTCIDSVRVSSNLLVRYACVSRYFPRGTHIAPVDTSSFRGIVPELLLI